MYRILSLLALLFSVVYAQEAYACTAAVISGRASADGRPLLWKHRDTGELDNRLEFFRGERYCFNGLVNSHGKVAQSASETDREVWAGANTAGFAIINTASYNIKDDDVPAEFMDREGILIFRALGICATTGDFENFLDTLSRPFGVEANFGVIDAFGGAAMYEVDNDSYIKYDVNDPEIAPDGYIVFTNFSFSGREKDRLGYERYLTASAIFREAGEKGISLTPGFMIDSLSRSFRNEFTGVDYSRDLSRMIKEGMSNGVVPDQDFIPRRSTSASVVVQGVKTGEDPLHTVVWSLLGYPPCSVSVPVPVSDEDHIPSGLGKSDVSGNSELCDMSLMLKDSLVFRFKVSNGQEYLDLCSLLYGREGRKPVISCCRNAEKKIVEEFRKLHCRYTSGKITSKDYLERYDRMSSEFIGIYRENALESL